MRRLRFGVIELTVLHARPSGHVLHLAGTDDAPVTHRVLMLQRTAQHVGEDFHVAMWMGAEPAAARDDVVIQHAQTAEAHPARVMVAREGKAMMRVEPAVVRVAPVFCLSDLQHSPFIRRAAPTAQYFDAAPAMLSGYIDGVELRHLRYFVVVAELNNVSKAAQKLRVAQPALSRQIRDLEEELRVPLLERTSRGVSLTEAGKVFATGAREVLARADEAVKSVRAVARGESGEVHLGYAPSPTAELLPRALHAFQNAAPGVRVVLHDNSTEEILRGLSEGTLNIALLVRPVEDPRRDLVFEPLLTYPMCVAVAPAHPLARHATVRLQRLLAEQLVVYARSEYGEYHALLKQLFAPVGRVPTIAEECDSGPSLIAAVEALRGVAIVPSVIRCLAGGRLKLRPLRPEPESLVVGFAYRSAQATPATKRLLETLRALRNHPSLH